MHETLERELRRRELEREAVALVKQYGFFLPGAVKAFFRRLSDFLNWQDLKKEL